MLIYSNTMEEHHIHVMRVLKLLKKAGQYLKPDKRDFHVQKSKYLGLSICADGIPMDPGKDIRVQE